jgi:hypothetical protein
LLKILPLLKTFIDLSQGFFMIVNSFPWWANLVGKCLQKLCYWFKTIINVKQNMMCANLIINIKHGVYFEIYINWQVSIRRRNIVFISQSKLKSITFHIL